MAPVPGLHMGLRGRVRTCVRLRRARADLRAGLRPAVQSRVQTCVQAYASRLRTCVRLCVAGFFGPTPLRLLRISSLADEEKQGAERNPAALLRQKDGILFLLQESV